MNETGIAAGLNQKRYNMQTNNLVPAKFGVEGSDAAFYGYHDPDRLYNGFARPYFTQSVMESIIRDFNSEDNGDILSIKDFKLYENEMEIAEREIITVKGRQFPVYDCGQLGWTWEVISQSLNTYSVECNYCSNAGNPCTKTAIIKAASSKEALNMLRIRVRNYKRFMKMNGGSAILIYEVEETQQPDPSVIFTHDEDSLVDSIQTVHTGGNIYNDVIKLKDGTIVRIGEGSICVYKNEQADEENNPIDTIFY